MNFTENSRVKIPAILHLRRLGYAYLPLEQAAHDERANIFTEMFATSLRRLNPGIAYDDIARTLETIVLELDNEDLGEAFFKRLTAASGVKLIDFDDVRNMRMCECEPCRFPSLFPPINRRAIGVTSLPGRRASR